jgi:AraC-like DNA-binding protein
MIAILYIAIAQFAFGCLLSLSRPKKQLADKLLATWFALMAVFMTLALLKNLYPESGWAKLQLFPFAFTFGPFFFLYVRALTTEHARLEFADSLHMLPFAVFSAAAVSTPLSVDEDVLAGQAFHWRILLFTLTVLISIISYILLTLRILNVHQRNILQYFSYTSERITLQWVRGVVIGFTLVMALTMVAAVLNVFAGKLTLHPGWFLFTGFALFAFSFTYFGTRQPAIFVSSGDERFVDSLEEETQSEALDKTERYARSGLSKEQAMRYLEKLEAYMVGQKPYLKRDLTLQDVADALEIPAHHLTQALNEYLNKNFYTLVNEHRIEEAKQMLRNPRYNHLTVLAIAHDAGFNSKSSFNMTFKKWVGVTPSEFRLEV